MNLTTIKQKLSSGVESEYWSAAAELGEYAFDHPRDAWVLALQFGSSDNEDLRQAIATCVLEHLLEHHFTEYFPLVEAEILRGNDNLADTLRLSWKLGQSLEANRREEWDALLAKSRRVRD